MVALHLKHINICMTSVLASIKQKSLCLTAVLLLKKLLSDNPLVYGCTDPSAGNYNPEATMDDGSCHSPLLPCDIVPTGLFVDNIIHNRVVFNWSAPSAAPSHYMIRYREVGTSSWTVMSAGPVNSNAFTGTSRTRYFMEPGNYLSVEY